MAKDFFPTFFHTHKTLNLRHLRWKKVLEKTLEKSRT